MLNDRICQLHNLPSIAVDLQKCQDQIIAFMCIKCVTARNQINEVVAVHDLISTIDKIMNESLNQQTVQLESMLNSFQQLANQLFQFQQHINSLIKKFQALIQQNQDQINDQIKKIKENQTQNEEFYLKFIKKYYKGKYQFQYPIQTLEEHLGSIQIISEEIQKLNESDEYLRIISYIKLFTDNTKIERVVSEQIQQTILQQKSKTILLQEDCPIHEQELTLAILDKEYSENRLLCIDCIEECQKQGAKRIVSIKRVNEEWMKQKQQIEDSKSIFLKQREEKISSALNILQKQSGKLNFQTQKLISQIEQNRQQININVNNSDQKNEIRLSDLGIKDVLSKINFLICQDQNFIQQQQQFNQQENKQNNEELSNLFKEQIIFLDEMKSSFEQHIEENYCYQQKSIFIDMEQCQSYFNSIHNEFPIQGNFLLEEFNQINFESKEMELKLIDNWLDDLKNVNKLRDLAQIIFSKIKRSSSCQHLITNLNSKVVNNRYFNMKQMFQLIYNNSSGELQYILLRNYSENSPIPFVYQNPNLEQVDNMCNFLTLNLKLYHIFPECFPIINFSLSRKQSSFGKTTLINEIFFKRKIFETNDFCQFNLHTIDIMFDFSFNGTRQFAVADAHGIIPFEILTKLLPMFKLWIIQMDSEAELEENFEQWKLIKKLIKIPECCFIVRNSNTKKQQQKSQVECEIESENIEVLKMIDLTKRNQNQQIILQEYNEFQKFIFDKISKIDLTNLSNSFDYLQLLEDFYGKNYFEIGRIQEDNKLILEFQTELNKFTNEELGFYDQTAFQMSAQGYQIKNLNQQLRELEENSLSQIEAVKKKIFKLEQEIQNSQPSKLLELFLKIFGREEYYILYLRFTDQLSYFNQKHSQDLEEKTQAINEQIHKMKLGKNKELRQKNELQQNQSQDRLKDLKKQLEINLKRLNSQNIGIESFWRELIQLNNKGQSLTLKINLAEMAANLMKKGESFEFLNRDSMQIDQQFLTEVLKQIADFDNAQVLSVSILGPQNSGKSTILNTMFGGHLRRSVGRCSQGIYLQLLKITQKQYFDCQCDYILILDIEGLQNSNQSDAEFDKKAALFILAISDIIFINVKGDIHSQFRNLVEMCIYNLGEIKNSFQAVKHLCWCFNQNNDCKNYAPFLEQIESIVTNLNMQIQSEIENQQFDYHELLDIKKDNIKILGFASREETWRVNQNTGVFEEWRQQTIHEIFPEEAYIFGVSMVKQFTEKIKIEENYQLYTLCQFVQNVENSWSIICRFPDLLEFTELSQYKQDQSMKAVYEKALQRQQLDYQIKIPRQVQDQVLKQRYKTLEFFKDIENDQKSSIQQELTKIKLEIVEELQKFKQENKILKKIYKKYLKFLDESLSMIECNCLQTLFDEIKKHEREFQQNKGFIQLDEWVAKITSDAQQLKQFKGQRDQIENKFTEIWNNIIIQAKQEQLKVFQDYSYAQYQAINSSFAKYQYISANQEHYQSFFLEISKINPVAEIIQQEQEEIMKVYFKEIQSSGGQFTIIQNTISNIKYQDIFHQPIQERFKQTNNNLPLKLKDFFIIQSQIYSIQGFELYQYLTGKEFYKDYQTFMKCRKNETELDINKLFSNFFSILNYCNISYIEERFVKIRDFIFYDKSRWFYFGLDVENLFSQLAISISLPHTPQMVMIEHFSSSLKYNYPSLKLQERTLLGSTQDELKEHCLKLKIQFLFLIKQYPRSSSQDVFLDYVADQKSNSSYFKQFQNQITQWFDYTMIKTQSWKTIYFQIYDIIKQKSMAKQNQETFLTQDIDSENGENFAPDNDSIKQIMLEIEQKILDYNEQFAKFGVIFSFFGERCIYYYSIFIIQRFLSFRKWQQLEENYQRLEEMKSEQLEKVIADIEQIKVPTSI